MDTWKISVLKNSALDYNVRCMGPGRWDFPLPAVVGLLSEKTEAAPWVLT